MFFSQLLNQFLNLTESFGVMDSCCLFSFFTFLVHTYLLLHSVSLACNYLTVLLASKDTKEGYHSFHTYIVYISSRSSSTYTYVHESCH